MAARTAGELLVKCLAQEKVRTIFAVPDVSYNPILGKLKEYGIRLVPPRHEAAAAHMADGWSRSADQPRLFEGATKWNAYGSNPKRIPEMVQRAFRMATSGKPGPVHLDVPEDVIYAEVDETLAAVPTPEHYRATRPLVGAPALVK